MAKKKATPKKKVPAKKKTTSKAKTKKLTVKKTEPEVVEKQPETQYNRVMEKAKHYNEDGTVRAVVMTAAGSQIADDARKRNSGQLRNQDCIHRPKDPQ